MSQKIIESSQGKNQQIHNQVSQQEITERIITWLSESILGVSRPKSLVKALDYNQEKGSWSSEVILYYQSQKINVKASVVVNSTTGAVSINPKLEIVCNELAKLCAQERVNRTLTSPIDRINELNWLREHSKEYANLWVALDGDKLLASGENHIEVFQLARSKGVSRPLIVKVASENQIPFVGW